MRPQPNLAATAALIADPARAAMLMALMGGRARPAGELAYAGGVTAQTASSHLGKLLASGLVTLEREGRHRYYRLAGAEIASALEHLGAIASGSPTRRKALSREAQHLQCARRCYDHLAGRLGVAVTQALQQRKFITAAADKQFVLTPAGRAWFKHMGVDVDDVRAPARGLARQCLDWTERQHHLAGPLGVRFMAVLCAKGWLMRSKASRAIEVTAAGWSGLQKELGIEKTAILDRS